MVCGDFLKLTGTFLKDRQQKECKDDPADDGREIACRYSGHECPAEDDSEHRRRQDFEKQAPHGEFAEGMNGEEVGQDEHREDDAGGFPRGHDLGHQKNARDSHGAEARFADAYAGGRKGGVEPLLCGKLEWSLHASGVRFGRRRRLGREREGGVFLFEVADGPTAGQEDDPKARGILCEHAA